MPARLLSTSVGVWKGKQEEEEEEEEDTISKGNRYFLYTNPPGFGTIFHKTKVPYLTLKCFVCEKFLILAKWSKFKHC